MSFSSALKFVYGLQTFGMKFGLDGIRRLLAFEGNPHRSLRVIHIAGTNGKGSTASMLAAILTAAGYRTGLYTSPHLVHVTDRIRIDGKPISPRRLAALISALRKRVTLQRATFFETMTAIALKYFADEKVDVVVLETGLGGRLDATNAVTPILTVITSIDLEHTAILGNTIAQIAKEKGGIIKNGVPCVCGPLKPAALHVIVSIARRKKAPLIHASRRMWRNVRRDGTGFSGDAVAGRLRLRSVHVALPGTYQETNAAIALRSVETLRSRNILEVSDAAIREGLAHVVKYAGLHGRMEMVSRRPRIMVDVAHNPAAARAFADALVAAGVSGARVVLGVMKDKNLEEMAEALRPVAGDVFAVRAKTERSRSSEEVAEAFARVGVPAWSFATVRAGVLAACRGGRRTGLILVTGSHFVAGEALAFLRRGKYLTINQ